MEKRNDWNEEMLWDGYAKFISIEDRILRGIKWLNLCKNRVLKWEWEMLFWWIYVKQFWEIVMKRIAVKDYDKEIEYSNKDYSSLKWIFKSPYHFIININKYLFYFRVELKKFL